MTYDVGPWAEEKYRRMGMYAEMFSTGMKNAWDALVYLDLFAGPGHSVIRGTQRTVLGSPLISLELPDRFHRYVFADGNSKALHALRRRVKKLAPDVDVRYSDGDANDKIEEIIEHLSANHLGPRTLTFCFLDPYGLNIHFETVRRLSANRPVDFLILLALFIDANRNVERYANEESEVIDRFLGDGNWRPRWVEAQSLGRPFVAFLAEEYSGRMASLGYIPMTLDQMVKIRSYDKRLPLYYLAFFSRDKQGIKFWEQVLKYADDQLRLL
jgi:three-Cys-motif partner protein